MASLINGKDGTRKIQFVDENGDRQSIYLSGVNKKDAESLKIKVEALLSAKLTGSPWTGDLSLWVNDLSSVIHRKLAKKGLVPPRENQSKARGVTLGKYIEQYRASRTDVAKSTQDNYAQAQSKLIEFFGIDKPLTAVTSGDADEFRIFVMGKLAENTARRICGRAKQFFRAALRKKIISENPFEDMRGCDVRSNPERFHYVTTEAAGKIFAACPDAEWRLIFALARFGGLRTPSETLAIKWGHINWENDRITIPSPKTGMRIMPIFQELRPHLEAVFEEAEPGSEYVITRYRARNSNLRTQFLRIVERAGVEPWQKPFQNCRSTRETELCNAGFPIQSVVSWLGNSVPVASRHYLQVREEDFTRASGIRSAKYDAPKAQKTAQHIPAESRTPLQEKTQALDIQGLVRYSAASCDTPLNREAPRQGLEPWTWRLTAARSTD